MAPQPLSQTLSDTSNKTSKYMYMYVHLCRSMQKRCAAEKMKRARDTRDDGGRPVSGTAKEEIDVTGDSEEEAPTVEAPTVRVTVMIQGSSDPAQRLNVKRGTPITTLRSMLFGVMDDGQQVTFLDRDHEPCVMSDTADLRELFDMAAE